LHRRAVRPEDRAFARVRRALAPDEEAHVALWRALGGPVLAAGRSRARLSECAGSGGGCCHAGTTQQESPSGVHQVSSSIHIHRLHFGTQLAAHQDWRLLMKPSVPNPDPCYHTANVKKMLDELIEHLRQDTRHIAEPKAQALFETSAEVLQGLR